MKILVKNYSSRSELEQDVKIKKETQPLTIEGTIEQLERLSLSSKRLVFGIQCVATDEKKEIILAPPKPNRGEIFESNLNNKKIKFK